MNETTTFLGMTEAAAHLGIKVSTLRTLMKSGKGPKFLQIGTEKPRFRALELEMWLDAQLKTSLATRVAAPKAKPAPVKPKKVVAKEKIAA